MSYKKCSSLLLLICAALLFGAREAKACECRLEPITVLDEYDDAAVVVIARVASVKKSGNDAGHPVNRISSTGMVIEQVFKGGVKVGEELTFRQGDPGECVWAFDEKEIGWRYLLYLYSREENPKVWAVRVCGRSQSVDRASDDLLYLNRLDEVRGKTRISGTVTFVAHGDLPCVGGRVIRIRGANKVHEVKTNERGVYEIYDLPPGAYRLEADTPPGWRVGGYFPRTYTSNFDGRGEDLSPKQFYVFLEGGKHVSFDVRFEKDVAGRGAN
jgi:hypothetical protein